MSSLTCPCGKPVSDNAEDHLRSTAEIMRANDSVAAMEKIVTELVAYGEAKANGSVERWSARHFPERYLEQVGEEAALYDLISGELGLYTLVGYECEACGRLLVQESTESERYVSYAPDSGSPERVFGLERETRPVGAQRNRIGGVRAKIAETLRKVFRG